MEHPITATELARNLGDVLARVRYRHDTFIVQRNGVPVARLIPMSAGVAQTSVVEALRTWWEAGPVDAGFADDLERINKLDQRPSNPWASS